MIDILVYLFENYHDLSAHPKQDALARKLGAAGFEEKDVAEALAWLAELKSSHLQPFDFSDRSTRILAHDERCKLGTECHRFLLFLESAGLATGSQREHIIDRAMLLEDYPVPLGKFKIIALMVLWSSQTGLEPLIVEDLLYDDSESTLLH